jgi:hypothetical protein
VYTHFIQGDERWGSYVYGKSNTLKKSGCMITGLAILQAYADPNLRNVDVWNPEICARNYSYIGNCICWDSCDPTFKVVEKKVMCSSKEKLIETAREYKDNGYYMLVYGTPQYAHRKSHGHFSPIVGWDTEKDEPILWDVATGDCETALDQFIAGGGPYRLVVCESTVNSSLDTMFADDATDLPAEKLAQAS